MTMHDCDPVHCCECERCADIGEPGDGRCIRCGRPDSADPYDVCDECDREMSLEAMWSWVERHRVSSHVHSPVMDTGGWYCAICGVRYVTIQSTGTNADYAVSKENQ